MQCARKGIPQPPGIESLSCGYLRFKDPEIHLHRLYHFVGTPVKTLSASGHSREVRVYRLYRMCRMRLIFVGRFCCHAASGEAGVCRVEAKRHVDRGLASCETPTPTPFGAATVLRSHSRVALSSVTA